MDSIFPQEFNGVALVAIAASLVAYALTSMVRGYLVAFGHHSARWQPIALRTMSTIIGALSGAGTADIWLEGHLLGGLIIGTIAGSQTTAVVWVLKTAVKRRLGIGGEEDGEEY